MKIITLSRITLLACAFGAFGLVSAQAASGTRGDHGMSSLTPDQKAELKKDSDQVLAAHPELQKEADALKAKRAALGSDASAADKQALHTSMHEHMEKMKDAILKIDPKAQAIFDAMRAAHKAAADGK